MKMDDFWQKWQAYSLTFLRLKMDGTIFGKNGKPIALLFLLLFGTIFELGAEVEKLKAYG